MTIKQFIAILISGMFPTLAVGQSMLVPDWVQTRSHATGQNSRVALDGSMGLVYWTLSTDDNSVLIPHAELNVYDLSGNDLTPVPAQQLNLYVGTGPLERESIEDPSVVSDTLVYAQYDQVGAGYDRSTIVERIGNTTDRSITFFGHNNTSVAKDVWEDAYGSVSIMQQARLYIHAFNKDWLPLWQNYAGNDQHAVAASEDLVFLARLPEVTVFDRTNGDSIQTFTVNTGGLADRGVLLVEDNALYHAYQLNDVMHVGKTDLNGNDIWDRSTLLGDAYDANEIVIDGQGAVWVSASLDTDIALDHADGGRLISVDPTGSFISYYTYGSTMTDLAEHNGIVYVCGKLDQGSSTSYLAAAQPGVATAISEHADNSLDILIYPQPAEDQVTFQWNSSENPDRLQIHDAYGRLVHEHSSAFGIIYQLNVSSMASGLYSVTLFSEEGEWVSKPFLIR